ncbi:hypothetical protein [Pseudooctadecabacter sp.]|uniref:hypothetical protein n=1 Tax=Pseudooctadecabacter sp. TaxID=1966338 RepID=UPI0035C83819
MFKPFFVAAAAAFALSACDVSYPVAVVGPSNTIYRGHATAAFLQGGFFQASNGNNFCQGRYSPQSTGETSTFPVTCSNGLSGIGTATFEDGTSGGGIITMEDGSRWQFIFGRGALRL